MFTPFDEGELLVLMSGIKEISVDDWRQNTFYKGDYTETKDKHKVIQWFWEEMKKMDQQSLRKILKFTTGSGSIPVEGFSKLQGFGKQVNKFTIDSGPL
jgi:hypothetical protein